MLVLAIVVFLVTHDVKMVAGIFLVACADDMAVAIPLAVTGAMRGEAQMGVIVKSGRWLDALADVKYFAFDKTGDSLELGEQVAQHTGAHQRVLDLKQVRREENHAALGAVQQRAQVMHTAKGNVVLLAEKLVGLICLREPLLDGMEVVAGQE